MFDICKIRGGNWLAEIAPDIGANILRLQHSGKDVLVPLRSPERLKDNPYLQGAPILLPANRTANGEFIFENKKYFLPVNESGTNAHLHGLVHRQPFCVEKMIDNEITLFYENKSEIYPFAFRIEVVYRISNDSFWQEYSIKNMDMCNMPVTFALHTSFTEPDQFSVPIDCCQQKDEFHIPTGHYVPLNPKEQKFVNGSASKGIAISGYYKSCGNVSLIGDYNYTVSHHFDHWILFNSEGVLCVEPQCGAVNGLNIADGHLLLKPNEMLNLWTKIERRK